MYWKLFIRKRAAVTFFKTSPFVVHRRQNVKRVNDLFLGFTVPLNLFCYILKMFNKFQWECSSSVCTNHTGCTFPWAWAKLGLFLCSLHSNSPVQYPLLLEISWRRKKKTYFCSKLWQWDPLKLWNHKNIKHPFFSVTFKEAQLEWVVCLYKHRL